MLVAAGILLSRIAGLVPGLKYTVAIIQGNRITGRIFVDLTIKAGEVRDLGDVSPQE